MRTFCMTSNKLAGNFLFTYNEQGLLSAFELEGEIEEKQLRWILPRLPLYIDMLDDWKKHPGIRIIERKKEISFDDFYDKYANKIGKKAAIKAWGKLSQSEQIKAYYYIQKYNQKLAPGIARMYPASYLNAEPWND